MSAQDLSGAAGLTPGFWEVGGYKNNVKRIRDGIENLEDLSKMVKERAEIEAKYAKALQAHGEKWRAQVDESLIPGSVKSAWLDLLGEGDALALQHSRVRDRLLEEIVKTLALYRKENHHPSAFRAPKESREIDEAFEKAQRQWKKLFEKVEATKKTYYAACRQEKSTYVAMSNSQNDSSLSQDNAQKFKERYQKAKEDVTKSRGAYESALKEITQYQAPYVENMTFVFEKCQQIEMKRMKFAMEMLFGMQQALADLIRNQKFAQLHNTLESTIKGMNDDILRGDLANWSSAYGIDAKMEWPSYEEYTPEMRHIASKREPLKERESGGVVLTRQIIKDTEIPYSVGSENSSKSSKSSTHKNEKVRPSISAPIAKSSTNANWNRAGDVPVGQTRTADSPTETPQDPVTTKSRTPDDFDEEFVQKARVLYDYNPVESDEIPLKKGETIEVLSDVDSLGWCTGRRNGETGLFPASYVMALD